ncbi:MAG: class I SAM-dependent methyltransferase [Verrucomicrobiia bacterium]
MNRQELLACPCPAFPILTSGHMMSDIELLRSKVEKIKWYHQIDLGNGVITPGIDNSPKKLQLLHLPERLDGKTVLDVGAWDGFFSFEAERRGAKRVLATDQFSWSNQGWGSKAGFELARMALRSKVEDMNIDVLELSPERLGGTFDVVFFLGVLYHMRHPLLALEKIASVTKEVAIIESVSGMLWCRKPVIPFYPGSELYNDPSNWCAPNAAATIALLKTAGFRDVKIVGGVRPLPFRLMKAMVYKFKFGSPFWDLVRTDRIAVHAWK